MGQSLFVASALHDSSQRLDCSLSAVCLPSKTRQRMRVLFEFIVLKLSKWLTRLVFIIRKNIFERSYSPKN